MDYMERAQRLLGLKSRGGSSSHAKRRSPVTPEMRDDAWKLEGWTRSGKTVPLYRKFGPNPKAT